MEARIDAALTRGGGALHRARLVQILGRAQLDHEIRRGQLVRLAPCVYGRPWSLGDLEVAEVAAVRYASPDALLSHLSALRRLGLSTSPAHEVHVLITGSGRGLRGMSGDLLRPSIAIHRGLRKPVPDLTTGVPTVTPALAIVQSWPYLRGADQRAPAIAAVRSKLVTVQDLRTELVDARVRQRAQLLDLLTLLEAGCESELELWGYRTVFAFHELAHGKWQYSLRTSRGRYRLDLAYPAAKLAVELDGRAYHAADDQWTRDITRDLELATLGWQTVRLSHRRLTTDVNGCRRDVLAVLEQRRGLG